MNIWHKITKLMIFSLVIGSASIGASQEKHPRVAEAESYLADKAFKFLRGRFPQTPMVVTAQVTPLRRTPAGPSRVEEADLPFGMIETVELKDEWDDDKKSILELLPRMRYVNISVRLPQNVSDGELALLRNDLFAYLNLIPARDKIEFERKNWLKDTKTPLTYWLAGGGVLLFVLLMLFFIMNSAVKKLSGSLGSLEGGLGASNSTPAPAANRRQDITDHLQTASTASSDMNFNDRISLRNDIRLIIRRLKKEKCFPGINDMIILDDLAQDEPETLGAILMEFSRSDQERLFSMSPSNSWLSSFTRTGSLTSKCYDVLERISLNNRDDLDPETEILLISVWRLKKDISSLVRKIDRDDAFSILSEFPLSVSIPVARDVFPGAWAILLDSEAFFEKVSDPDKISEVKAKALEVLPWNEFTQIKVFRKESSLIGYVRESSVEVEKDIYEASKPNALIQSIRPPFYRIFDQSQEVLSTLVPQFSLEDWAICLLDSPREKRECIKLALSEKQWFIVIDLLKKYDRNKPDSENISRIRESIAKKLSEIAGEDEKTGESRVASVQDDDVTTNEGINHNAA